MKPNLIRLAALGAASTLIAASCGSDPEEASNSPGDNDAAPTTVVAATTTAGDVRDIDESPIAGHRELVIDGETIAITQVRCHLESQPAAGVGGNILFVVQGEGRSVADEPVTIDVSRYDNDSMFPGDAVQVYIGDFMADEAQELSAQVPIGTVNLDGSIVTAEDLALDDLAASTNHVVSFTIAC